MRYFPKGDHDDGPDALEMAASLPLMPYFEPMSIPNPDSILNDPYLFPPDEQRFDDGPRRSILDEEF